mmetsp:Transcript_2124/g.5261  ORF Transcript_2124/g.5261 Transcript_2124/m.5261 type:complete len:166 (+) Transcript_2124:1607-2104(+)
MSSFLAAQPVNSILNALSFAATICIVVQVTLVAKDVFNSTPIDECPFCLDANSTERILLNTDSAYAIQDQEPKCVEHYLVLPKTHIKNIDSPEATDEVIEELKELCLKIFEQLPEDLEKRMMIHSPPYYSVHHLHLHCLGCAPASWLSYQKYYLAFHDWQGYRLN